jgi:uncharacterized protein (TIGR02996 family)
MSIKQAFLADILEHPDDDAPRLVYADWLEENGDSQRAEFIRLQCELARPRLAGGTARRRLLAGQVKRLLEAHGGRWAKEYGGWCFEYAEYWSRGFPVAAYVECTLKEAADRISAAVAVAPVRRVDISIRSLRSGDGAALAKCAALARLKALCVFGQGFDDSLTQTGEIERLVRSPNLQPLEQLELVQVAVGEGGGRAILELPRLSRLFFYSTGLDNRFARDLARSPLAARLTEVRLGGDFSTTAAKTVAQTPAFRGLSLLDFDNSTIGNVGARHLAGSPYLTNLRELRLHNCGISDEGAAALASSPHLTRLKTLVLSRNAILGGVLRLIDSSTLPRGLHLDLWDNHIEDYSPEIRAALRGRFRRVNFARSH